MRQTTVSNKNHDERDSFFLLASTVLSAVLGSSAIVFACMALFGP